MTGTKRRVTPVRLTELRAVAISREDYQQAVTALAAMIQQWWQHNQQCAERIIGRGARTGATRFGRNAVKYA